jgi:RalA-binding protein 1
MSFLAPKPQEEDPVFILAIYARSDSKQLWRVEKTIVALPALDAQLKALCDFHGKLPDRALFSGHAPAKMDARRAALNLYFDAMLETPMSEKAALVVCEFFSTDVIGAQNDDSLAPEPAAAAATAVPATSGSKPRQRKDGYLTKRGKNFGGWKARYFVLDGPEFRYYEVAGGAHLGTIKLHNAQIGKQSQQQANQSPQRRDDSEDNQYRHAFLILEPKRKDSSSLVRHVLCAESDEERDAWVEALLQHVDWQEEPSPTEPQPAIRAAPPSRPNGQEGSRTRRRDSPPEAERSDRLQGFSYDSTVAAQAPIRGPTHREAREAQASSPKNPSFTDIGQYPSISGPTNGAPIQNAENWGNKSLAAPTSIKDKKRSIFGFRGRGSSDIQPGQIGVPQPQQQSQDRFLQQNRNIFGIPLQEAVEFSQPVGVRVQLPSVVYRCLEYLKAKKAYQEEGIFRLSGSNIVIKGLRDRFNNEGDVKLLDGEYYDVHAVASLLKLYLRELPASILTREYHLDFLKVLGKIQQSSALVSLLTLMQIWTSEARRSKHSMFSCTSCHKSTSNY